MLSTDIKRIISNVLSLSYLHIANLVLPLISMPYLVRVLGLENYGLLMFAQAIMGFINECVDFGFAYSATREVSVYRHDKQKINIIFCSVLVAKFLLMLLAFVVLLILTNTVSNFVNNKAIFFVSFLIVVGNALFPVWFFLGMENMKYISLLNILTKIVFTVSVFIFVHHQTDVLVAAALFAGGYLVSGCLGIWLAIANFKIELKLPTYSDIVAVMKDSSSFFMARISAVIYGACNPIILGFFIGNESVGIYSIAEKLYFAVVRSYQAIANTLYPYMSKAKNIVLFKKILLLVFSGHLFGVLVLWWLADWIVAFFIGSNIDDVVAVFHVLLIASIFTVVSVMLTYPLLAALGCKTQANLSSVFGVFVNVIVLGLIISIGVLSPVTAGMALLSTEVIVCLVLIYYTLHLRLLSGVIND